MLLVGNAVTTSATVVSRLPRLASGTLPLVSRPAMPLFPPTSLTEPSAINTWVAVPPVFTILIAFIPFSSTSKMSIVSFSLPLFVIPRCSPLIIYCKPLLGLISPPSLLKKQELAQSLIFFQKEASPIASKNCIIYCFKLLFTSNICYLFLRDCWREVLRHDVGHFVCDILVDVRAEFFCCHAAVSDVSR